MKLSFTLAITASLASSAFGAGIEQYHALKKNHIGNSLWAFGSSGVHVFSPDGSTQFKHVPSEAVCQEAEGYDGSYRTRKCRFYDVVSDGKKYVWAATEKDTPMMDVFDIDTGAIVGSFEMCLSPNKLEYHPLRDEIWARCGGLDVNSTDPTHLDVISASAPSGQIMTNILVQERALAEGLSSSGSSIVHSDLGDMGYLTDDSHSGLFMIDLSKKDVVANIALEPASNGLEDAVYSEVNGHIFAKAEFCCTCGSADSDVESCGRGDGEPVSPVSGKSAGQTDVTGTCGRTCDAVPGVNNVGIYEFDTKTQSVVATHKLADGMTGRPFVSANGKYVVLLARNGGQTIRILEAGSSGSPSKILVDLELDFNHTGYEDLSVAYDFAFVEKDGRTIFVMPSGTEHSVAIVDFTNGFDTKYVKFSDLPFENGAPHGRYRRVEWAVGTNYVWTDDSTNDELYVIDVIKGELVNTIPSVESRALLSVQNFERLRIQDELMEAMAAESSDNSLAIAAIVIGSLALIVGLLNMIRKPTQIEKAAPVPESAYPPSQIGDGEVDPSLASVN